VQAAGGDVTAQLGSILIVGGGTLLVIIGLALMYITWRNRDR
jgi:hypothetical protein